jgi:hypothetical protein
MPHMVEDRPRKRYQFVRCPSVLVLREKHETRYFHVPDEAALFDAALIILEGRMKEGRHYSDPGPEPKAPEMTLEQIKNLPDGPIKSFALKSLKTYQGELKWWRHLRSQWGEIQGALKSKDGEKAWAVLYERSTHEYEGVEVCRLETEYR